MIKVIRITRILTSSTVRTMRKCKERKMLRHIGKANADSHTKKEPKKLEKTIERNKGIKKFRKRCDMASRSLGSR